MLRLIEYFVTVIFFICDEGEPRCKGRCVLVINRSRIGIRKPSLLHMQWSSRVQWLFPILLH